MNLQHLRYFLAMMETGSVSRAATLSSVTQPTLSAALKRLEAEFGVQLFTPDGRTLRALPAATHLEQYIRLATRAIADARRQLLQETHRALRVGLLASLAPAWLSSLSNAIEGYAEFLEGATDELASQIAAGRLDLALTALSSSKLRHHIIAREPYRLFVCRTHEFAGQRRVALSDLDGQPFVLRQSCEQTGSGRRLLRSANVRVKVVARVKQETTAAMLVAAGVGITLAPQGWGVPGLRAVEVKDLPLEQTVALVWKTKDAGLAASKLLPRLRSTAQS
jgi:DNA-binding transcriptional LysR family regulator